MEELWSEVDGYPNYVVSNHGNVVNLATDKLLRPRENEGGLKVALSRDGVVKDFYIHQLVAVAFFGNFRAGTHILHVNGDKTNNSTRNLRLKRGRDTYIRARDDKRPWGRRVRIIETGEVFRTVHDCARHIGGDFSSVYRCLRGERQHHLGLTFEYYDEGDHR